MLEKRMLLAPRKISKELQIPLKMLLNMYFVSVDPTALNRQGNDVGVQYRTGIYYTDKNDLATINEVLFEQQKKYHEEIVIEVLPLENFYPAEDYHQDSLETNPDGYCHLSLSTLSFAKRFARFYSVHRSMK